MDGDSTQSCQAWPVVLNQRNRGLQGLLLSPSEQFAGLRACEGCHGSCWPSASSQTSMCKHPFPFYPLGDGGHLPAGPQPEQKVLVAWGRVQRRSKGFLRELICPHNFWGCHGPAVAPREQSE